MTLWRSPRNGHKKTLHATRECPAMQQAADIVPVEEDTHPDYNPCDRCMGDAPGNGHGGGGNRSLYERAKNTNAEVLDS